MAQPRDAAAIKELVQRALPDIAPLPVTLGRLGRDQMHPDERLIVAVRDIELVGMILVQPPEAMLMDAHRMGYPAAVIDYIYDRYRKIAAVAVADDTRGRGIGRQLVSAAAREVWPAPGRDRLLYGQFDWDARLRRFYRGLGFWVLGPDQPLQFAIRDRDGTPYEVILPPSEPDERWFVGLIDGDNPLPGSATEKPVDDPRVQLSQRTG